MALDVVNFGCPKLDSKQLCITASYWTHPVFLGTMWRPVDEFKCVLQAVPRLHVPSFDGAPIYRHLPVMSNVVTMHR